MNGNFINKNSYEKRKYIRVDFKQELYYPLVNNESIYKNFDGRKPILSAINISETGICFKSIIKLNEGDFISFLMKVENKPSFWCLCQVKWVRSQQDNIFLLGCEFYLLSLVQLSNIREYIIANL
ncbi:PilZ domain-containing protein [Clostridium sp. KNHs214]|uniref:PilZ domain-containing protein n=1 Tax=Clostridium sp. KNHs214 TaxID=1540257 RepID=UPI00054F5F63|nr:PilZ domain-containing protein [Clostridium sp. KNHs214]